LDFRARPAVRSAIFNAMKPAIVRYAIVIERTASGFSAHVPDLPSCWAEGPTVGLVQHTIRQVLGAHFAALRAQGLDVPAPSSQVAYLEVTDVTSPTPGIRRP
jgi:predicted RNase H-like HicB family nuclease